MNKKIVIVIVIVIVLLGAYFATRSKKDSNQTMSENQATGEVKQDTSNKGQKSMKDFLSFSGSQKCTVSYSQEGYQTTGVAYVANGKMRGEYTATMNGQTTKPQFISDGQTIYSWQEGEATGFKMTVTATQTAEAEKQNTVNMDQQVDYDCENWSTDNSKFTPPSNVKFTDYSEMLNNLQTDTKVEGSGSADLKAMQCQACAQAPEESRAQCLQALGCN